MPRKTRCTKCGREVQTCTLVLMMGPQGYRRYPVCESCNVEVEKAQSARAAQRRNRSGVPRSG